MNCDFKIALSIMISELAFIGVYALIVVMN